MRSIYSCTGERMGRGFFIAIEGIDGAGKTTQVGLLEEFLRSVGEDVVRSKEPTDGPWGRKIRESAAIGRMSLDDELAAFIEDRREHVRDVIQPALNAGKTVILDRYFYSTIAYQGSHGGNMVEIERKMLAEFPTPDLVFLIDVPSLCAVHRICANRKEQQNQFEQREALSFCRTMFLLMLKSHRNIVAVNGERPIEEVHGYIRGHLRRLER